MNDDLVSQLLMLTADDIDYAAQSEDTLAGLTLGGDPYIATYALGELSHRFPSRAADVAGKVVRDRHEDDSVRASALQLLLGRGGLDRTEMEALIPGAGPELRERIEDELH